MTVGVRKSRMVWWLWKIWTYGNENAGFRNEFLEKRMDERGLQTLLDVFDAVCKKWKLNVIVFGRCKCEVVDFYCPYMVRVRCPPKMVNYVEWKKGWRRCTYLSILVWSCARWDERKSSTREDSGWITRLCSERKNI